MELRQLEYFVAVAEERSFTLGAAKMHVVQSAMSATIKSLEKELGTALFDRSTRQVELTEAGRVLLGEARATLQAAASAKDAVAAVRGGLSGTVRIGTMNSVPLINLAGVLGTFHARHPNVAVHVSADPSGSRGLVEGIINRRLDLAFVSTIAVDPSSVHLHQLAQVPIDLVAHPDHPLARGPKVNLSDLAGHTFIDSPQGYGNRTLVDEAFRSAGQDRTVTIELADIALISDFVANGLGLAFLPRFAISESAAVKVIDVVDAELNWPLALATPAKRSASPAAASVVELIIDSAVPDSG